MENRDSRGLVGSRRCLWPAGGGEAGRGHTGGQPTQQSVDLHVFGVRMRTYWTEHPEERAIFDVAMRSIAVQVLDAVVSAYDFSPFHTVVDVGGGYGAMLSA